MRLRVVIAALVLGAALACQSAVTPLTLPYVGSFTLVQVDAAPLPARGTTAITLRGTLDLQSSFKYVLTQTDSAIAGGAATPSTYQGSWQADNGAVVLANGTNALFALGAVSGDADTVRLTVFSHTNVYVRK